MRIVCPACAATYEVPDHLIGAGRSLRCRACGHAWRIGPAPAQAAGEMPAAPPGPASPVPPPPPFAAPPVRPPQLIDPPLPRPEEVRPRPGLALRLAWAASLLAVGAMLLALWLFRAEIVEAWPPAARLYLLFGAVAQG